jgi:hypothetical protein
MVDEMRWAKIMVLNEYRDEFESKGRIMNDHHIFDTNGHLILVGYKLKIMCHDQISNTYYCKEVKT